MLKLRALLLTIACLVSTWAAAWTHGTGGAGGPPPTLGFHIIMNEAGADFGGGPFWPTNAKFDYWNSKGVKIIRLPFKWEVMQKTVSSLTGQTWSGGVVTATTTQTMPANGNYTFTVTDAVPSAYNGTFTATVTGANTFTYPLASNPGAIATLGNVVGPLDPTNLAIMDGLISHAASNGQTVEIDVHNFASYSLGGYTGYLNIGSGPTSAMFAQLWTLLATHYVGNAGVYAYELMNEPCCSETLPAWQAAAQAATTAIRAVDTNTTIIVDGIGYSAAPQWIANNNTLNVVDPQNKLVYDPHAYADSDNSGSYVLPYPQDGSTITTMQTRMAIPVGWASTNSHTVFHGEGGVPDYDPNWLAELDNFYAYMQAQGEPTSYWASGAWGPNYPLNPEQKTSFMNTTIAAGASRDDALTAVITKYTGAAQPTVYFAGGPSQGPVGLASANFEVQYFGNLVSNVTVTPSDGGAGGTFTPSSFTLASGTFNPQVAFTYTAAGAGSVTLSFTNSGTLTNPANLTYTAIATSGLSAFEYMGGPVVFAWAPFQLISTYSSTGNSFTALRSSDSTSQTFALPLSQSAVTTFCGAYTATEPAHTANGCTVTTLYDQSGNASNGTLNGGMPGPVPHVNAQNSQLCLHWPTTASGLKTVASIHNAQAVSLFSVNKPNSISVAQFMLTFNEQLYYPIWDSAAGKEKIKTSWIGTYAPSGIGADVTAYHENSAVIGPGDFPLNEATFTDGASVATYPTSDGPLGVTSPLVLGYFPDVPTLAYQGEQCQIVVVAGDAGAGGISRVHTLDQANWGTP